MNRTEFHGYVRNPGSFEARSVSDIKEVLKLFPWFQSAHMLLLRGLKNSDDVRFDMHLKESATHIADREKLYYLINIPAEYSGEQIVKQAEPAPIKAEEPVLPEPVILAGTEPARSISELRNEIEQRLRELDDTLLVIEGTPGVLPSDNVPDDTVQGSSIDLLELEVEEKSRSQSEIIDQFINLNPRLEVQREPLPAPAEDLSEKHSVPSANLISETLARIYIDQGYYSRAIDLYEKLCLKYPGKSSYFADQIQKIEDLIK